MPAACRRCVLVHRAETDVHSRPRFSRPPCGQTPAQRRPMRMWRLDLAVLADLPVDVVAVLEQQEGAGQAKRTERPLGKR